MVLAAFLIPAEGPVALPTPQKSGLRWRNSRGALA